MKKLIMMAVAAIIVTGCKTTEANYRAAYETVIERNKGESPTEGTIYHRYRDQRRTSSYVIGETQDTVEVSREIVSFPKDGGAVRDSVGQYNVVVGGFKQVFNAKAMRDRLNTMDYEAFVVNTREPLYYVVAFTTDSLEIANEVMLKFKAGDVVSMRSGYPFVLEIK